MITPDKVLNLCFWSVVRDDQNKVRKIFIDNIKFCDFLYHYGFRRFDVEDSHIFIRIIDSKILKAITITEIQDFVFNWLDQLPINDNEAHPEMIKGKILGGISFYFNKQRLYYLRSKEPLIFNADTISTKYFYYLNGFVTVTAKDIVFKPYEDLKFYIWDSQVLNREFNPELPPPKLRVTKTFFQYIAGEDMTRLKDLMIMVGYFLHDFTDYKLKAALITDAAATPDEANGRTGKTLFARMLGYMISKNPLDPMQKTFVELNGKDFDFKDKHRFSPCGIDTKIMVLNDIKKYFDVEMLYNAITEGVTVDKKNMQPFNIHPKIIVVTNKTVNIEGDSSKDRFIEFEFSEYFSSQRTPEQVFKHWLHRDWNAEQWQDFNNTMHKCSQMFFANGCKLNEPAQINLNSRKFQEQTHPDFVEFMELFFTPEANKEYLQKDIYTRFCEQYPEQLKGHNPITPRKLTEYMKRFVNYNSQFQQWDTAKNIIRKKNEGGFYVFYTKN